MNIYYLRKFRKAAWKALMLEYRRAAECYLITYRDTGKLYHIDSYESIEDGIAALQSFRREIVMDLIDDERSNRNVLPKEKDNRYLAEL